tara:strand:+ start:305 stop:553 length:249 start_codon:yes stop_codon:yes gene_type:complete
MQNETTMKNQAQINREVKKAVIKLMGKGQTKYSKTIIKDNDLFNESEIIISYESTCQIDVIVDYKLNAEYNKETEEINLIQF